MHLSTLQNMAVPLLSVVGTGCFLIVVWLLWTDHTNKKATKAKLYAFILLENHVLWEGLCDYADTKVRAPWNKGGGVNKEGDRVQVFNVEGDQIWYTRYPAAGFFQQTVPCAFFHERLVCSVFPPEPCNCGHAECEGMRVPEMTPSQWGLVEDEHVTEATMKATLWVKEMFDQMGALMGKLVPAWVTIGGFIVVILALIVMGFFMYRFSNELSWLHGYLSPSGGGGTTP